LGPDAHPVTVGAVRLAVGAAGLAAVAVRRGGPELRRAPWKAVAAAGAGMAAYQVSFFAAVRTAGVALGTAVTIGSAPLLAGALARWVDRVPLTRRWWAATALAVGGVAVIGGTPASAPLSGVAPALAAGAAYAVFAVGAKRLVTACAPPVAMAAAFGAGSVLLSPALVAGDISWLGRPAGLAMAGWLGVVTVTVAYLLFAAGLSRTAVATAATLSLAEPLTAALLGALVLGERPPGLAWLGSALLLSGLAVLAVRPR
jgi:DME family drug/metabolite transporter